MQVVIGVIDFLKKDDVKALVQGRAEKALLGTEQVFGQYKFDDYAYYSFCIAYHILDTGHSGCAAGKKENGDAKYMKADFCNIIASCRRTLDSRQALIQKCTAAGDVGVRISVNASNPTIIRTVPHRRRASVGAQADLHHKRSDRKASGKPRSSGWGESSGKENERTS